MAILTISRQFGSKGKEVGEGVASALGYDYVGKHRFLSDLKTLGDQWEQWGETLDEHAPSIWEKYDWSFAAYGALIQSILLDHALADRTVIMERGGNVLLRGVPHAYRIRIVAPLEDRIKNIARDEFIDAETARWLAKRTDHERSGFIYSLFGIHWDDPAEYDQVFDTGELPIESVVSLVTEELLARDQLRTPESLKILEMRALAAKVKAGLVMDPKLFTPTLDVEFDGNELVLRGIVHSAKEHKRLEEAAKKLAGDQNLRCELGLRG
ncbi:MAG: cytidylate kinase family protein [Desulfomonile sp.]|nr:cytidylate kinase family protein [Desulfomonile sp.]